MKCSVKNAFKNHVVFGTSILTRFWQGLGADLEVQNRRFLHFFRCFFEAFFEQRFGSQKNRKKIAKGRPWKDFLVGPAECAAVRGEK